MSKWVMDYVGGPFHGQRKAVEDPTKPEPVWGGKAGARVRLRGQYIPGVRGQRGKMIWQPEGGLVDD